MWMKDVLLPHLQLISLVVTNVQFFNMLLIWWNVTILGVISKAFTYFWS